MTTFSVNDVASFQSALSKAKGGDTILLASGTYSGVNVFNGNYSSTVWIRSANTLTPAIFTDLKVANCTNLSFSNLELSSVGTAVTTATPGGITPFIVQTSNNISFSKLNVHGDSNGTLASQVSGFLLADSTGISITQSNFSYLHNAITHLRDNGLTLSNNTFSMLFDDGIRGGGSSNVKISYNTFTSLHYDWTDTDHTDCIQFWTTNMTNPVSNITINNNTYTRGLGNNEVHGIFFKDETGTLPFNNVSISNNNFSGASTNGITIDDAVNLTIANNVVTSYPDARSWIEVINSTNSILYQNKASIFVFSNDTKLTQTGNTIIPAVPFPASTAISTNPATVAFAQALSAFQPASSIHTGEQNLAAQKFGAPSLTNVHQA